MTDNHTTSTFRPPAVPLVACDPYFSIWSCANNLTDDTTRHWTGMTHGLTGLVRVDGRTYRILGADPDSLPALPQTSVTVLPTRTAYTFASAEVQVTLSFLTAALPHDLEVLARPVTYVTWDVQSTDDAPHEVSLYFDAAAEIAVDTPVQAVTWGREDLAGLTVLKAGSVEQNVLGRCGDDLRIDWGYLYVAAVEAESQTCLAAKCECRDAFAQGGSLPGDDEGRPRAAHDKPLVLACALNLGAVGAEPVSRTVLLAYDDLYSIQHLGQNLRPYWRRNGASALDLLRDAAADYEALKVRCETFDAELMTNLEAVGGAEYARLAALSHRQCLAAHKLVAGLSGEPLYFSKENFSNGCIATVDVTYPSAPFFLLFSPELLKAQLTPVLDYAASDRWPFPYAPHDLGTYPLANGQVYGGGEKTEEKQMPVEECGNMLLLVAAVARYEGDVSYAQRHWPLLTTWAQYLSARGLDPENQLCTDDFAGHLAHNANLSLKAILALGAYARLGEAAGHEQEAQEYRQTAEAYAKQWATLADDGDHYRLAFDKPGTWSLKYNLVWDRLLELNLFPAEIIRREIAFYKTVQNAYGVPLDSRKTWSKLDWLVWIATLAEAEEDFRSLLHPAYVFAQETPNRIPLTDWYDTVTAHVIHWHDTDTARQRCFQARSVVGGVFIKLLSAPHLADKWRHA